ncbi:MAG TPA: VWA domain-containing protein [Anaerolineae bacterium]|nr:VWA domain-containing protein [Anaerolineae bacterium]HPL29713.1 VWA domain-containing protein [Anaerolineae bacterium]
MAAASGFEPPESGSPLKQLAILVLDRSGSMVDDEPATPGLKKFEAVRRDVLDPAEGQGFIARLKGSTVTSGLYVAMIFFDDRVEAQLQPTPVSQIDPATLSPDNFTPRGATAIGDALEAAQAMAQQWLAEAQGAEIEFRCVGIFLMSDGENNRGAAPIAVADAIKTNAGTVPQLGGRPRIVIGTAAYGADADEATLRQIASAPWREGQAELFARVTSGAQLRNFLVSSSLALAQPRS